MTKEYGMLQIIYKGNHLSEKNAASKRNKRILNFNSILLLYFYQRTPRSS